jgi:hypothetical protein
MSGLNLNSLIILGMISTISCHSKSENKKNEANSIVQTGEPAKANKLPKTDTLTQNSNKDWLLVPGKSAGNTRINEDAEKVYTSLGKPDGGDAAMGKSVAIWYSRHDSTSYSTSIYTIRDMGNNPVALVKQIRVTSPTFKTKDNIHVTSSLSDIRKIYVLQIAEKFKDAKREYAVYDSKEGIAFEIDADEKCVAITIHESGKAIPGTYLKFRTTNKFIGQKQK